MDQQQHMTITEAHPYHGPGRTIAYNGNCPKCRHIDPINPPDRNGTRREPAAPQVRPANTGGRPFSGSSSEEHLENLAIFLATLEQPEIADRLIDFVAREWDLNYAQIHRLRALACGKMGLPKNPVVLGQGDFRHDGNGHLIDRRA